MKYINIWKLILEQLFTEFDNPDFKYRLLCECAIKKESAMEVFRLDRLLNLLEFL